MPRSFKQLPKNSALSQQRSTCGQNKLNAHLFGEERVDVGFEDQWIDNSRMADRDLVLTVDKNGQRHFSQMAWINKRPTTSITAQVTPRIENARDFDPPDPRMIDISPKGMMAKTSRAMPTDRLRRLPRLPISGDSCPWGRGQR